MTDGSVAPEHLHLLRMLESHASTHPDKPFLVFMQEGVEQHISFSELRVQARHVAERLSRHGDQGVVFISMKHSPYMYAAFLGCMLAGLIPSFLPFPSTKQDPHVFFEQHRELFRRTPPVCVMTYAALIEPLRGILPDAVPIVEVVPSLFETDVELRPHRASEIALLQHSSGTTGLKKGVALTFDQIARQTAAYAPVAGLDGSSVVVSWLPLYHDMGLFTAFIIPLTLGATVVSMDAFEWVRHPAMLLEAIGTHRGTHVWLPNFAFEHILAGVEDDDAFDLASLKLAASCSEPVKPATLRRFGDRFPETRTSLCACYAMAESCFAVSQGRSAADGIFARFEARSLDVGSRPRQADHADSAVSPVRELTSNGPPILGIDVGIAANDRIETGSDTAVGEIALRGSFVFREYHRSPEVTKGAVRDGWYHTGDVGFLHDGELFICGRTKELIIVNGRNFYCHDIETIVSNVPGVIPGRAVAIGVEPRAGSGEQLLLIVEPDGSEAEAHLMRAIKDDVFSRLELTPYRIEFVARGWLVKTTSGKLSRSENLRRLNERRPAP